MKNTSDIIMDTLLDWGVTDIFGLPGDGINGLFEAMRERRKKLRFHLVRHEEAAAFAACGYAKFRGGLGVCIATSGPGAIHLLNGLYDAKLDQVPVLAITGHTFSDLMGSRYQQEVDVLQLYSDVASAYNIRVNSAEHARLATDLAIRNALGGRTVAHINVPSDVQTWKLKGDYSHKKVPGATSQQPTDQAVRAPHAEVRRAAKILNDGERIVLFVGQGARGAREEILALSERLQAPIIKALLGKDVIPDDHPNSLGGAGLLGTTASENAIEDCDTIFFIGSTFPYLEYLPKPGHARGIQLDIDAKRIGLRYPVEVGLLGDTSATLRELLPEVRARSDSGWLRRLRDDMDSWNHLLADRAARDSVPMKPQRVAAELDHLLDDDAIVTCDSGTIATWAARHIQMRGGRRFSLSGNLATMAPAIPYAMGAQVAFPERQVVAFIGDGGCLMLGSELSSLAQARLPVKIVVINNHSLGMIKWEQMAFLGNPSYGVDISDVDFVAFAEAQGVRAWGTDRPDQVGALLEEALQHDGPALVECVVDPNEPPYPPTIKADQAVHMSKALVRGQQDAPRIGFTMFRDKVRDIATHIRK